MSFFVMFDHTYNHILRFFREAATYSPEIAIFLTIHQYLTSTLPLDKFHRNFVRPFSLEKTRAMR